MLGNFSPVLVGAISHNKIRKEFMLFWGPTIEDAWLA
jgi:hypothetical protein